MLVVPCLLLPVFRGTRCGADLAAQPMETAVPPHKFESRVNFILQKQTDAQTEQKKEAKALQQKARAAREADGLPRRKREKTPAEKAEKTNVHHQEVVKV